MKYNNIIFLGLCLGLTTYSALSADSVIKISGRVLDYGCTVSSDSLNFTVDLQKNSARQFPTTGSTSPAVPFQNTFRIIDFSVPPTAYGKFMSTIFMQWVKNDVGEIFIRQFESFVSRFLGNGHTSCIFQESCKDNLVVESNGDIYECDHFVYPQYKIGNINKSELKTMNSVQLTAQKKRISAKCQQCVYKPICNGGCPKHRITKVNNETISYFCEGYKILFSTMVPYMNAMVELAKNRVPLYHIMDVAKQMENN